MTYAADSLLESNGNSLLANWFAEYLGVGGHIQQKYWLLCGLKLFALDIFSEKYLQPGLCVTMQIC